MPQVNIGTEPYRIGASTNPYALQNNGTTDIYLSTGPHVTPDQYDRLLDVGGELSWPADTDLYAVVPAGLTGQLTYLNNGASGNPGATRITGPVNISGGVDINGPVTIAGTVPISGDVGINAPVAIAGTVPISGDVTVSAPVSIAGTVPISGDVTVSAPVSISGTVPISGDVGITGPVEISGPVAISGTVPIIGNVGLTGPVEISGPVAIAGTIPVAVGNAIEISGNVPIVPVPGQPIAINGAVSITGGVAIAGTVPISGNVGISAPVSIAGTVPISGNVGISAPVSIAGTVPITGNVGISGPVSLADGTAISVTGDVGITGPIEITGPVAIAGTIPVNVGNAVAISGQVPIIPVTGKPIVVNGAVSITGGVAIAGTVPISGNVGISGPVAISGSVPITGNVGLTGPVTVSGNMNITNSSVAITGSVGSSSQNNVSQFSDETITVPLGAGTTNAPWTGSHPVTGYTALLFTLNNCKFSDGSTNTTPIDVGSYVKLSIDFQDASGRPLSTFSCQWLLTQQLSSPATFMVPIHGQYASWTWSVIKKATAKAITATLIISASHEVINEERYVSGGNNLVGTLATGGVASVGYSDTLLRQNYIQSSNTPVMFYLERDNGSSIAYGTLFLCSDGVQIPFFSLVVPTGIAYAVEQQPTVLPSRPVVLQTTQTAAGVLAAALT